LSRLCHVFITIFVIFLCYPTADMSAEPSRETSDSSVARSLVLDHLAQDPTVARRLSPSVVVRHRALPVAEEDHCVTVTMADPSDTAAPTAVAVALGAEPCVVRGDPAVIAVHLSQIWDQAGQGLPNPLACILSGAHAEQVRLYAEYVGHLLGASVDCYPGERGPDAWTDAARRDYELVISGAPDQSSIERLLKGGPGRSALDRVSTSVLFARSARRPLRKLLLVVQGEAADGSATDWALRLAGSSGAAVTALAVVPPVPAMYHGLSRLEGGLAELLSANTALGRQMRRVARQLVDRNIEGKLRIRQGAPAWEVRREAVEGEHDLVAVAAAPQYGLRRWLLGELATSIVRVLDRPVLIAR
jgi:nucleotide-binding universal stress UspA family protein